MKTPRHRTSARALLAICCSTAMACPSPGDRDAGPVPPGSLDAGPDGGNEVDGGPNDGGGEGEGEGECYGLGTDVFLVQPNDAGVIPYEECELSYLLFGSCSDGSCAANETQAQMIEMILDVARARGYDEQVEIVSVDEEMFYPTVLVVYVVDWARATQFVQLDFDDAGVLSPLEAEVQMPSYLPRTLPPLSEVLGLLRDCSADLRARFCLTGIGRGWPCSGYYQVEGYGGFGTANCVGASVQLWDPCNPDAGPSEVTCNPADVPCCE